MWGERGRAQGPLGSQEVGKWETAVAKSKIRVLVRSEGAGVSGFRFLGFGGLEV